MWFPGQRRKAPAPGSVDPLRTAQGGNIVGFLWTQRSGHDATADWRCDDTDTHLSAFRQTLTTGGVAC